jgi:hypothetical protein
MLLKKGCASHQRDRDGSDTPKTRSTTTPLPSSSHCRTGTPTGTTEMSAQTWTFAVQTKSKPMRNQTA